VNGRGEDGASEGTPVGGRREVLRAMLGAAGGALSAMAGTELGEAHHRHHHHHHHHKGRHKRCRQQCQGNLKTCDRGCDILDGDSRDFCKQGCRVALSQCQTNC